MDNSIHIYIDYILRGNITMKKINEITLERLAIKVFKLYNRGLIDKKSRDTIIDLIDKAIAILNKEEK